MTSQTNQRLSRTLTTETFCRHIRNMKTPPRMMPRPISMKGMFTTTSRWARIFCSFPADESSMTTLWEDYSERLEVKHNIKEQRKVPVADKQTMLWSSAISGTHLWLKDNLACCVFVPHWDKPQERSLSSHSLFVWKRNKMIQNVFNTTINICINFLYLYSEKCTDDLMYWLYRQLLMSSNNSICGHAVHVKHTFNPSTWGLTTCSSVRSELKIISR